MRTLDALGFGEMVQPDELPNNRTPWVLDNAAFKNWKAGKPFDECLFLRALDHIVLRSKTNPDFIVVPDVVAGGLDSLSFSVGWRERMGSRYPHYLAVQDGMLERDVAAVSNKFDGLFVGGTLHWKIKTTPAWVSFGHCRGMPVHVGRVGTRKRAAWATRIVVDSIDSCLPLFSTENLRSFLLGLNQKNMEMFDALPGC